MICMNVMLAILRDYQLDGGVSKLGGGGILDTVVVHPARTVLPRHRHAAVTELTTLQSLSRKQNVTFCPGHFCTYLDIIPATLVPSASTVGGWTSLLPSLV